MNKDFFLFRVFLYAFQRNTGDPLVSKTNCCFACKNVVKKFATLFIKWTNFHMTSFS